MSKLVLELLDRGFTIYRFQPMEAIPSSIFDSSFYWIGKTDEELSIVCDSSIDLRGGKTNAGWVCFKVLGPIDFSVVGVLSGISSVLASAQISIFAISTFDTDYILVKSTQLERAESALLKDGYCVEDSHLTKLFSEKTDRAI